MNRTLPVFACALLALALLATPVAAAGKHVTIKGNYLDGYKFKPKSVTIEKGKTVHWSWDSDTPHNVTFEKLNGRHSKTKSKVDDFKVTFKNKGTFKYECTIHDFHGTVVVKPPS
ncbi:MAG TPA: plastocyanin/azurin family copper-binding protein [Thermoleophilaceae bacterium]|nr:plastocyanin/azurin family copper-binding protein [Thermoleophilaceae bacterium]